MTNTPAATRSPGKWLTVLLAAILFIAFFIAWVSWDKTAITGSDMPNGNFFKIADEQFKLANPFPQFNFAMPLLWLIPAFAIITIFLTIRNKRNAWAASIAGILALCLISIYVFFTNVLVDLGVSKSYGIGFYLAIIGAAGIILASSQGWGKKIIWLLIGPLAAYLSFTFAEKYVFDEKHENTSNAISDYTVNATDLIKEFQVSDSAANAKYREKILTVSGTISELENPNDSTASIKFADSTGSYAIFPFLGESVAEVKKLKSGDKVSVKASCSGGVLSEILGTESITFKRCVLNNK
jgi:hypothetical protein